MLNQALTIAQKEAVDGLRDVRSVISSGLYALMGPFVVGLVALRSPAGVIAGMMSVFTLVAAFVGGMNVAMDTVAGERERQSLLPLLLNPVSRLQIVFGKWLGICVFAVAGFTVNIVGSAAVLAASNVHSFAGWTRLLPVAIAMFSLPLLAAAMQLLISTVCRNAKEAQTYLSLLVFFPMGAGMFLVFSPGANRWWTGVLPILGQQVQLESLMKGKEVQMIPALLLGGLTVAAALILLLAAANRLQRDEIVYGS